jgi:tetrahydromethanopterin S-methyltransferase subunit F
MGAPTRDYAQNVTATGVSGWVGWVVFAGIMMVILGSFHAIEGLIALFQDDYFLVSKNGLSVHVDYTVWGWVHLIGGIIVVAAGVALFVGKTWARAIAVIIAMISAIVNIGFLSAYPIWSTIVIALDVIVIFALTVHWKDVRG